VGGWEEWKNKGDGRCITTLNYNQIYMFNVYMIKEGRRRRKDGEG
jgi:hypothetical protein